MNDTFCKRLNDSASFENQFNATDANAEKNKHIYFMLLLFTQEIAIYLYIIRVLYVEYHYYYLRFFLNYVFVLC